MRQAVLRLAGGGFGAGIEPGVVRVVDVADPSSQPGFEKFVSAAVAGSGQSAKEIEETQAWRREEVEAVATGKGEEQGADLQIRLASGTLALAEPASSRTRPCPALRLYPQQRSAGYAAGTGAESGIGRRKIGGAILPPAVSVVSAGTVGEDGSLA